MKPHAAQVVLGRPGFHKMDCLICNHPMDKTRDWLYHCPACKFARSTLSSGAGRGVDGLEVLRRKNFRRIIAEFQKLKPEQNLKCLEVGCAEGWFIDEFSKTGATITAIEASDLALEMQKKGLNVIHGFFPEALPENEKYDLIIFNDVKKEFCGDFH